MNRTTLDLWVGFFVALGIAALIFLATKVGSYSDISGSHTTYSVKAYFKNIGGLKPRAPVKSAGVVVGRVGRIRLNKQDYTAYVRLDIDSDYAFPTDTSAAILTSGLLGEQYVGLVPGADDETLKKDDIIKITQDAVVLENLIGQFMFNKAAETPTPAPAPAH
ncbi:MAG: outer membrane lipid asymmetry maintenance protein MlaD [Azoarcus sp.]|jgi:phospholipid/cholesterol/gamma-HCH transport system substrate-binding protein|nr:outer membrane lipid asymmetry maintenance protein MlaD [Azoarcus sp.]